MTKAKIKCHKQEKTILLWKKANPVKTEPQGILNPLDKTNVRDFHKHTDI